ncbi:MULTISPECIES: RNA polymerase sigma factor [Sphingomonas]|nr:MULTISPECIES: sigma-70 family RNA polymerase sigma factor [Sphingomonas]
MQGERQIFEAYGRRLWLFVAARTKQAEDVDDITQETFLRFYAFSRSHLVEQPLGYLYRIALNIIIDRARRRTPLASAAPLDDIAEHHLCVRPEQEEARRLADLQRAYADAIAEMPPRCAEVFRLRRHREMTTPDVAAHLSITPRMVQKHMVLAMAHLHARLRAYVACDDPVGPAGDSVPTTCQIASSSQASAPVRRSSSKARSAASVGGASPVIATTSRQRSARATACCVNRDIAPLPVSTGL